MSEMVERVALAIANAKRAKHDIPPCGWEHLTDEAKTEYVEYARAAIETMRPPNSEMQRAGWVKLREKNDIQTRLGNSLVGVETPVYEAMINEALK